MIRRLRMRTLSRPARHWSDTDFVVTVARDGNRYGYCGVCKADMQQFSGDEHPRHYSSHETARRLGLWGKRAGG